MTTSDRVPVGLVTRESGASALYSEFSGLMGLGPSSKVLHAVLDATVAGSSNGGSRAFSFYLSTGSKGQLVIGGWDDKHQGGPIQWFPCKPVRSPLAAPYWTVENAQITFGDMSMGTVDAMYVCCITWGHHIPEDRLGTVSIRERRSSADHLKP